MLNNIIKKGAHLLGRGSNSMADLAHKREEQIRMKAAATKHEDDRFNALFKHFEPTFEKLKIGVPEATLNEAKALIGKKVRSFMQRQDSAKQMVHESEASLQVAENMHRTTGIELNNARSHLSDTQKMRAAIEDQVHKDLEHAVQILEQSLTTVKVSEALTAQA